MPMYEFRCQACGDRVVTEDRQAETHIYYDDTGEAFECGALKRVWSVGFSIKSVDWSHD